MNILRIEDKEVPIVFKNRRFSRRISIRFSYQKMLVVSKPCLVSEKKALEFVFENVGWIKKQYQKLKTKKEIFIEKEEYLADKKEFVDYLTGRVVFWGRTLNLLPEKIKVGFGRSRWGSCSRKKVLNFNYRLSKIDKDLIDYVVVHELCHLQEFNHSHQFWRLVGRALPDYKEKRKRLKEYF